MKVRIYLLVILLVAAYGCQQKESETETLKQKPEEASVAKGSLPSFENDYLVSIYEAQELIKIQQDDVTLRKEFCDKAYLPEHRLFVSMGIARLHHPDTGAPVPEHLAEKAARLDAIRWAAYGRTWLENNYQPAFGQLQANFQQDTELINKAHVGDSLFVFLATRMP